MSGKFQTIDQDTGYLLPPSLQDWLPETHLARFVVDTRRPSEMTRTTMPEVILHQWEVSPFCGKVRTPGSASTGGRSGIFEHN